MSSPEDVKSLNREGLLALVAALQRQVTALQKQVAELEASVQDLRGELDRLTREKNRQAASFSKGTQAGTPAQSPGPQAWLGHLLLPANAPP
jgi:uncharacterized protein YlxW (UPF0749 family)